jgi:TolA-binding protein
MMAWKNKHLLLLSLLLITGCSLYATPEPEPVKRGINAQTLGDQYFAPQALDNQILAKPALQDLRQAYADLLPLVNNVEIRKAVQLRLADLSAILAEQQLETGIVDPQQQGVLSSAIEQYQNLLNQALAPANNMEILYQLAKAYDQQGQPEKSTATLEALLKQFPQNPYVAEANFRLGEQAFSRANYPAAITAYNAVVEQGAQSAYFPTSAYMLGWSYFKLARYAEALRAFTLLLDNSLPNDIIAQPILTQVDSQAQIDALGVGDKRLVNDTLRVMSLVFSYREGQYEQAADSLMAHFAEVGPRHYEYVLYNQLAQLYLNQGRFREGAQVYQRFAQTHEQHFQAAILAVKEIDAYILGKFPSLVLPAKQLFVERYGIHGDLWSQWGIVQQELVGPFLNQYLQELAQFEHSRAQLLSNKASGQVDETQTSQAEQQSDTTQPSLGTDKPPLTPKEWQEQARLAYLQAAKWYREFLDTFSDDSLAPQTLYSMAEALYSAGQYAQAIAAFENYAYGQDKQTAFTPLPQVSSTLALPIQQILKADAGYAAILVYRDIQVHGDPNSALSQEQWLDRQIDSQLRYVQHFPEDSRALDVLYVSMQQMFDLTRYLRAIELAQQLQSWQPAIDAKQRLASQLVIAHSQFALADYAGAEASYQQVLLLLAANDPRRADLSESLAASIYKQAELNVKQHYLPLAVNDFLRVIASAPDSLIRVNAQYDAATYLLEMQEWQQAIELLEDFRQRFPHHPLQAELGEKLIVAYQQNQNWQQAADELYGLWQSQPTSSQGQQALYVAAQYYYKIGQNQQALEAFRHYAHAYPQPLAEANEARFVLSEIYLQRKEGENRRFWLNKMITADQQAAADANIGRSDRSRYLAAMSSLVLAEDKVAEYKLIKLTLPLKTSLAKKKQALNDSTAALQRTLDYKVGDFSSAANYYMADLYAQLAKDLLASSKPKNLNALELEQYDLLLEEQAFPFEEQAITLHETNAQRAWRGVYDSWVQLSFAALQQLLPARYNKQERLLETNLELR